MKTAPSQSQLQQYDGPALEPLLKRIHKEHGPRVKIVKAERVREGGVLGFFAREIFRLTVDTRSSKAVQNQAGNAARGSSGAEMQGQSGATQSQSAQYNSQSSQIKPRGAVAGTAPTSRNRPSQSNPKISNAGNAPTVGAALRSHRTPEPPRATQRANPIQPPTPHAESAQSASTSTQTPQPTGSQDTNQQTKAHQQVVTPAGRLSDNPASSILAESLSQDDKLELSPVHQSTTQGGQPEAVIPHGTMPEKLSPSEILPDSAPTRSANQPAFADILAQVAHEGMPGDYQNADLNLEHASNVTTGSEAGPSYHNDIYGGADAVSDGFISDAPYDADDYSSFNPRHVGSNYAENGQEYVSSSDMVIWGDTYDYSSAIHAASPDHPLVASELLKTGIPEQLLDGYDIQMMDGNYEPVRTASILVDTFARLPTAPPPPSLPGSLLAIVGDLQKARKLAAEIATEVGSDPAAIPVVSSRSVASIHPSLVARSALEVSERAPGWRRNNSATVVVVVSPLVGGNRSWAKLVLAAMKPTAVWGMAEALYKTEEITAWAEAIGGVDALILTEVRHSVSPATAASTGIPIARLDESRASPERWATVVGDLLTKVFTPQRENRIS